MNNIGKKTTDPHSNNTSQGHPDDFLLVYAVSINGCKPEEPIIRGLLDFWNSATTFSCSISLYNVTDLLMTVSM